MSTPMLGFCRLVFFCGMASVLSAASEPVAQMQPAPKRDHQLFVGVDLVLNHEEALVPVRKIEKNKAQLDIPSREVVALRGSSGLQWRLATKVSGTSATIIEFHSRPVLSPAKNPALKQMREKQALQAFVSSQTEQREAALRESMRPSAGTPSADAPAVSGDAADAAMTAAMAEINQFETLGRDFERATDTAPSKVSPDAVELSFDISTTTPIADAYVVAVVRIAVAGETHDATFYRDIGRVENKPRRVRFLQAGMPENFEIKEARVHLYWRGEEIPTNLSEKNYAVTASEARMYLQTDHLSRHRFDSVPSSPAWSIVPPALLAAEGPADYDLSVTVEIDAEGRLVGIQTGNVIVPQRIRAIVEQMTFLPAVEKGQGVASTLRVNLAEFFKIN